MDLYIGGKVINVGDVIKDFRGDSHVFSGVSMAPSPGRSGKIIVNSWTSGTGREFYPSVFDGEIKKKSRARRVALGPPARTTRVGRR